MGKQDVSEQEKLRWEEFVDADPKKAIRALYEHAWAFSSKERQWYWRSIRDKRWMSTIARLLTFVLAMCGIALPLVAAVLSDDKTKLMLTQLGVVALAIAGLVHAADKIFGWSTGWLRYVATVTAMENLSRQFCLDWVNYMMAKTVLDGKDKQALFEIANQFEKQIAERQTKETDSWVNDFSHGEQILNELLRSSKDTDNADAHARNAMAQQV